MSSQNKLPLQGNRILIAVTGSIAAVKTPLLVSALVKAGAVVKCAITPSASKLVSPVALANLSRNRCFQEEDQWDPKAPKPLHIDLAEWAEIVVVAPLSASSLGKWMNGIADGLVSSLLLATEKPVIAAPAMNTAMWGNLAVERNIKQLMLDKRILTLAPSIGRLACDRFGEGKMVEPELIQLAINSALQTKDENGYLKKDCLGLRFVVTAGATIERLDIARVITNRSSGRMGVMLAQAARFRGANVSLIHGPLQVSENLLEGLEKYPISNAHEMKKILVNLQLSADFIAMAAAIADIQRIGGNENKKISKTELLDSLKNELVITPDLLAEIASKKPKNQIFLGFAALSGSENEIKKLGEDKRVRKNCDLLMANPIDIGGQGFETDFNGGWLLGPEGSSKSLIVQRKLDLAHKLLDELLSMKAKFCEPN